MSAIKVNLPEQAQGVLPVANGGTGAASLSGLVVGNGTAAMAAVPAPSGAVVGTTDTQTLSGKTLTAPTIDGYTEGVTAIGVVSSAYTLSIAGGTVLTATLTASTACTFTMPAVGAGLSFVLLLKQPSTTGAGSATFTGVKWPGGTAPTITTGAGQMDILSFISDGTDWFGTFVQGFTY